MGGVRPECGMGPRSGSSPNPFKSKKNKIKVSTNSSTAKQVKKILKNTHLELSSVYIYLSIISWEEDNAGSSVF